MGVVEQFNKQAEQSAEASEKLRAVKQQFIENAGLKTKLDRVKKKFSKRRKK